MLIKPVDIIDASAKLLQAKRSGVSEEDREPKILRSSIRQKQRSRYDAVVATALGLYWDLTVRGVVLMKRDGTPRPRPPP